MSLIQYSVQDHVAEILFNNPPVNALTECLLDDYIAALYCAGKDEDVRAVIISSAVPVRFCAGLDIQAIHRGEASARGMVDRLYRQMTDAQYALGKPSIAAITGAAKGGGMTMAISCDVIIASDEATFGYPEIDSGVLPSIHFTHLPRIVGKHRAFELLFSGRSFNPTEAKELGLVSQVVPTSKVMSAARDMAQIFCSKPRHVMRVGRQSFMAASESGYRVAVSAAVDNFSFIAGEADAREGFAAFVEKRKPRWRG